MERLIAAWLRSKFDIAVLEELAWIEVCLRTTDIDGNFLFICRFPMIIGCLLLETIRKGRIYLAN